VTRKLCLCVFVRRCRAEGPIMSFSDAQKLPMGGERRDSESANEPRGPSFRDRQRQQNSYCFTACMLVAGTVLEYCAVSF
jgi:hypothetical protein